MEQRLETAPEPWVFSFTRRDSDPDRARSDLAAAVEIIAAAEEVARPWATRPSGCAGKRRMSFTRNSSA